MAPKAGALDPDPLGRMARTRETMDFKSLKTRTPTAKQYQNLHLAIRTPSCSMISLVLLQQNKQESNGQMPTDTARSIYLNLQNPRRSDLSMGINEEALVGTSSTYLRAANLLLIEARSTSLSCQP